MTLLRLLLPLALAASLASWVAEGADKKALPQAPKQTFKVPFKVLSQQELAAVLAKRLEGGMGDSFKQFSSQFLVSSRIAIGTSIAFSNGDAKIDEIELQSPFPRFYKPTLAEFLDAIALQTQSKWSYEKEDQFGVTKEVNAKAMDDVVVITFTREQRRQKPFVIGLAEGWKVEDRGNFVTFVPPIAPVGMDLYEMGRYSPAEGENKEALMKRVQTEVALEWANRINPQATAADLKPARIGPFDALHYEATTPAVGDKEVRWRHWVFTADDRCFFVVSTLFPEQEKQLLPDVMRMLEAFKMSAP